MTSIRFPTGMTARAVETAPDASGDDLLAALDLPPPRGTVVLNGSAHQLDAGLATELAAVLGAEGLAGAAAGQGLTVVTGGTDAGIFSVLGRAMAGSPAPLIGVVPEGLVTWPGAAADGDRIPLEPHHSHFVLVDGDQWGQETPALLALARALDRRARAVAVICGGGPVTRAEVAGHVGDGRPVVVLAGSGRFADELADAVTGEDGDDPVAAEIAAAGEIVVCPVADGPRALAKAVLRVLDLA
ncbi:MAG: hypothetical protein M3203_01720 [Actinomycetota bacterium]|nr:hypothetical protein [Actinomycetota bacterium]